MRITLVGDQEYAVFTRIREETGSDYVPITELGLSTIEGSSGVDRIGQRLAGTDAVFLQADARLMLFVEPYLDELAENGIVCQVKPTAFNILANKPYTLVSISSRGIRVPRMRSVSSGQGIEAAVEGLGFPVRIEAFRDLGRTQTMILTDKQSLYPFLRSIPFEYNLILIEELLQDTLIESVVIGEKAYSIQRAWNAERLEHSSKARSTKMSSDDRKTVIDAARAIGADIATVKTIGGTVIDVDPLIDIERFETTLGVDLARAITQWFEEKIA